MELQSKVDQGYQFISGNTSKPWYARRRIIVIVALTALTCIIITIIAVYSSTHGESIHENYEFTELPPVEWDGDCPRITSDCPLGFESPPMLLLSLDSFRPDYLDQEYCPTISRLSRCGARAEYMISVYPTKTFPNHFSQVTGLYPAWHGIIDNFMIDPASKKAFVLGGPVSMEPFWWQREPIWVTAEKQGKKAATFFWPGSDVEINGTRPTYYKNYDTSVPFEKRVDQILSWLDLPVADRPSLLTLYFNEPDSAAHAHGIHANETKEAIARVDKMVARLFSGLQQRNLTDCINILFVSDHGMADIECNHTINLDKYIDTSVDVRATIGAFGRLQVKQGSNMTEAEVLNSLRCETDRMRVYRKEELPVRSHYVQNSRIEPLIVDIDDGWTLTKTDNRSRSKPCFGGNHGYDNLVEDMRATFISIGPSLKKNVTIKPFMNIELYELMCELVGIIPNPNNGTKGSLQSLLRQSQPFLVEDNEPSQGFMAYEMANLTTGGDPALADCPCNATQMDMDSVTLNLVQAIHLPFDLPRLPPGNGSLLLLFQPDFVIAYCTQLKMPIWVSYTLRSFSRMRASNDPCWSRDARLPPEGTSKCSEYQTGSEMLQRPLFPPGFLTHDNISDAWFVSNSVPKSHMHVATVEDAMNRMINSWTQEGSAVNVLAGPAFHPPGGNSSIPTHYFVVATLCYDQVENLSDCTSSRLHTRAVLLPNSPYPHNCEIPEEVILRNAARVVDVEYVTGLRLFLKLPPPEAARLRSAPPHEWAHLNQRLNK